MTQWPSTSADALVGVVTFVADQLTPLLDGGRFVISEVVLSNSPDHVGAGVALEGEFAKFRVGLVGNTHHHRSGPGFELRFVPPQEFHLLSDTPIAHVLRVDVGRIRWIGEERKMEEMTPETRAKVLATLEEMDSACKNLESWQGYFSNREG